MNAERRARKGRHYTNGAERSIESGVQERAPARGEGEESSRAESSLVPASNQTNGPSPGAEVARFLRRSFKFTFTD